MRERNRLARAIDGQEALERELKDQVELIQLGEQENDAQVVAEAEAAVAALRERVAQRRLEALMSGEADGNDSFLEVRF